MPIDRAATLRNAEKLLRLGKLEAAIAEYLRVVEDQPRDWNSANTLGDLYVRAGLVDKAVEQFTRIADNLGYEGFLPKAGALYKKILKVRPDNEHALLQAGEVSVSQGLFADARALLGAVVERRRARGDARGAAQVRIRIGTLDATDFEGRMGAASARVELGDVGGAVGDLKEIASELAEKGRLADAVEALREAALLDPGDDDIRVRLMDVYVAAEDFARAREYATTAAEFKALAEALDLRGRADEALSLVREAASVGPPDAELKAMLARAFVARGDLTSAAEYLTVETAGDDPQLLLTVAERQFRSGQIDEGLALARRLIEEDPSRRDRIAMIGWTVAQQAPEAGFRAVELAADAWAADGDWASAASALQEFVTRVPNHISALMRLIEICVDGGLDATMYSAQAQLAEAYIDTGMVSEARVIAEDLVAREPLDRANIERFRRTLVLMNEPDPDALIAERLSAQSLFTSTDLSFGSTDLPPFEPPADALPIEEPPLPVPEPRRDIPSDEPPVRDPPPDPPPPRESPDRAVQPSKVRRRASPDVDHFELSANAVDIDGILDQMESPRDDRHTSSEEGEAADLILSNGEAKVMEIDLSLALDDMGPAALTPVPGRVEGGAPAASSESADLNGVFERLRDEAGRGSAVEAAEQAYASGLALLAAGDFDGGQRALQVASRLPNLRFVTASLLARLHMDRGATSQAIEWFERAAQAPAPTVEESHLLLYQLAGVLEDVGETARALAVSLELQADAGTYRDIAERIERLANVQARG